MVNAGASPFGSSSAPAAHAWLVGSSTPQRKTAHKLKLLICCMFFTTPPTQKQLPRLDADRFAAVATPPENSLELMRLRSDRIYASQIRITPKSSRSSPATSPPTEAMPLSETSCAAAQTHARPAHTNASPREP